MHFGPRLSSKFSLNNKKRLKNHTANFVLMAETRAGDTLDHWFFYIYYVLITKTLQKIEIKEQKERLL